MRVPKDSSSPAPPTTPGPIGHIGRRQRKPLPASAQGLAITEISLGAFGVLLLALPPWSPEPPFIGLAAFMFLGLGVLVRSNLVRLVSCVVHGLIGVSMLVFCVILLIEAFYGAIQPTALSSVSDATFFGVLVVVTAFFAWATLVLASKKTREACRRPEG